jgi:RNA polymerase sigma-54 factor
VKPSLRLGVSQSLTLTPQLRQAIRLLQLSAAELEIEIREAVESNPLLEHAEDGNPDTAPGETPGPEGGDSSGPAEVETGAEAPASDEIRSDEVRGDEIRGDAHEASAEDWPDDGGGDWEPSSGGGTATDEDGFEVQTAAQETLQDHLRWQLNLTPLGDGDRAIGEAIIELLDEDGYLRDELDAVRAALAPGASADDDEIEAVRHRIQRFDPVGVASRDLADCLAVQLAELDPGTPWRDLALRVVREHLEAITRDRARLAQRLGVAHTDLDAAIGLLRGLDPKPGARHASAGTDYVVPDAYAYRQEGRWRVRLNPACQPSLAINRHYERMAASSRDDAGSYLRGRLQEARWLIRSIKARGETMMKVAQCIVRQQGAFLDYGPEAMRPLTLREVADEIGVHESTVSRVTTRKYLHTPRGTYEFKHFFSVGLATDEGGEASATAIRAMIRKLIEEEAPAKPLSDQAIAVELKRRGIAVARRTVAKYREGMNIPSSSDRCRLA